MREERFMSFGFLLSFPLSTNEDFTCGEAVGS